TPRTVAATNDTLPDGTLYSNDTDIATWVARDCSRNLPYVSWSSGRNDIGLANHRMWSYAVQMANALGTCHYGFSFIWGNGRHDGATASLENTLLEQYQTVFSRNISYPAFTHFSLDNNYGNGDPKDGTLAGCVNCGWRWKVITDTADVWSASFMNTQVTARSITDVTPRNAQLFKRAPGMAVKWSASTGQKGLAVADSYGLSPYQASSWSLAQKLFSRSSSVFSRQMPATYSTEYVALPIPGIAGLNHSDAAPGKRAQCLRASFQTSTYPRTERDL